MQIALTEKHLNELTICATSASTAAVGAYFAEHDIERKLNDVLNEMAALRPADGNRFLARRMRSLASGANGAAVTAPLMSASAGAAAFGDELSKSWSYTEGLQRPGTGAAAPPSKPAKGKRGGSGGRAAVGELDLTIEAFGQDRVLLAIREK